ncbi:MAG: IS66 family transposase [Gammaproteobacteria bacterium]|nr:IS66 family transposase [Gammaproteobacteria bacterium]
MQTQTDLAEEVTFLRQENTFLKEELAQLKRMIFGSKKERFIPVDSAQASLFGMEASPENPESEQITYTREKPTKKDKAKRLLLPAHLPRKEEIIEPVDFDSEKSIRIGDKVTEVLEYTPGKFFVTKTVRPVYKQKDGEIKVAELPTQVIPNGNAGASILAYLMVSKFIDHLPFYRQAQIFKRDGMKIAESTITGWFKKTSQLLKPLYELMEHQISTSDYIQADESPIPVLSAQKPGSTHKGYQWVFLLPKCQMVIFQYHQTRGKSVPQDVLKDFQGCLQTDGYAGYDQLGKSKGIIHIGCMAHARRKFDVAKDNDYELASYALAQIQCLYAIESKAKEEGLDVEQTTLLRSKEAIPILTQLKSWLEQQYPNVLPKSAIGKAISYTLKQWPLLIKYTQNGEWLIDNNEVENKIRPLALGRKNYLFAGSHEAAQQAAMMYSFFGTCKLNNIEPLEWLTNTLRKIPDHKINQLHELLPVKKQA